MHTFPVFVKKKKNVALNLNIYSKENNSILFIIIFLTFLDYNNIFISVSFILLLPFDPLTIQNSLHFPRLADLQKTNKK